MTAFACPRCGLPHAAGAACPDLGLRADARTTPLAMGTVLAGRFLIVRIVHHGSSSVVYLAQDQLKGGRATALKELRFSVRVDAEGEREAEAWFARESSLLHSLTHRLMPSFYGAFREGQHPYIAQEYIAGETLDALVGRAGPVQEGQAIAWGRAICDLLAYLHERPEPVIFRDLKPANIIVRAGAATLVVVDFGIATPSSAGRVGTTIGTPGYAPPEQYQGLATPESDIYALGATLHRLLTGYNPEQGPAFRFPPVGDLNPAISPRLGAVVARAVQLDSAARYPSARQLEAALAEVVPAAPLASTVAGAPALGMPVLRAVSAGGLPSVARWWPVLGGALLLLLAVGFGLVRQSGGGTPPLAIGSVSATPGVPATQVQAPDTTLPTDIAPATGAPTHAPPPPPTGAVSTPGAAVTYQLSTTHDGIPVGRSLTPPLAPLWTAKLFGSLSYPLIVGDAVFASLVDSGSSGASLHAFDRRTGATLWGPTDLGGGSLALAYDLGHIFSISGNGTLQALSARTGVPEWSVKLPGQYVFSSPPTARNGIVYAGGSGSGGTVYAVDETNGAVLWTASVGDGDGSPAVSDRGVYVLSGCNHVYDFVPRTGQLLWHVSGSCEGGGGSTPVLHADKLYTRDSLQGNLILDATSGKQLGTFSGTAPPTFDGPRAYYLAGSTLRAIDQRTSTILWSFAGDGALSAPPIASGGYVYVVSGKAQLYTLDAVSGRVVFSLRLQGTAPNNALTANRTVSVSMAAGNRTLVIALPDMLVALAGRGGAGVGAGAPPTRSPVPTLEPVSPSSGADAAVAYQITTVHDGDAPHGLTLPLTQRWAVDLKGKISYPLIVGNQVYVTVAPSDGLPSGTKLFALDRRTGATLWGPIDLGGAYQWSALTYDRGRVFALTYSGMLRAFDARTGVQAWSGRFGDNYSSPPTARQGIVYIGEAGRVTAVDERDGTSLWLSSVTGGDNSAPVAADSGIYVGYACDQVYALESFSGRTLWHFAGGCSGGGGKTAVLHQGKLYVRDYFGSLIIDAATGKQVGTHDSTVTPAFSGSTGFYLTSGTVRAVDTRTGAVLWSFAGDGSLTTAPVAGAALYVASSSGHLYALSLKRGAVLSSVVLPSEVDGPDEHAASQPLTGMAAAVTLVYR